MKRTQFRQTLTVLVGAALLGSSLVSCAAAESPAPAAPSEATTAPSTTAAPGPTNAADPAATAAPTDGDTIERCHELFTDVLRAYKAEGRYREIGEVNRQRGVDCDPSRYETLAEFTARIDEVAASYSAELGVEF
ncbi:hypothetical protein [Leucobacter luti]|uniref:Host cell surface-exposed lipoprotein n=1 Tax=Leucobacter luti TaxID=340320 RepID=A0A4Q7U809_9MICO|nr:hypothetical protein [Leucobacter luti]MBL3700518.1 hypothetical protein [Leucobacter luti]RZT68648.1 hypothetical protein EV139_0374 [Leucobacter luti]